MIFEEAIPGLLVGVGCSARCGRVSGLHPALRSGAGGVQGLGGSRGLDPTARPVVTLAVSFSSAQSGASANSTPQSFTRNYC